LAASSASSAAAGDLDLLVAAARRAGDIALGYFRGANRSWIKSGNSPVSQADIEADACLRALLLEARPDYGWLSEESRPEDLLLDREATFVVDPLDGTRGFLTGDPQWCVCAAVVHKGRPVAGVVHCPALSRTFAAALGAGATLNGERLSPSVSAEVRVVTGSKRLNVEVAGRLGRRVKVHPFVPSLAYRLALVATGEIDGAFARPGAHDWDIAAADLILSEAGGALADPAGRPVSYRVSVGRAPALIAAGPGRMGALAALAKSARLFQ